MKAENESLKYWKKRAKKVKEMENQLATERRVVAELKKTLDTEFVTKTNLEVSVEVCTIRVQPLLIRIVMVIRCLGMHIQWLVFYCKFGTVTFVCYF